MYRVVLQTTAPSCARGKDSNKAVLKNKRFVNKPVSDTVEHINNARPLVDVLSLSTVVATIVGWLPALAALLSIIWTTIRIYETKTVQKLLTRFRTK